MMEKPLQEDRNDSVHFTRHSRAEYNTYIKIKESDNPQAPVDYENQITPDLNEEGVRLAEQKTTEFFSRLDPEKDILFFASSNEARAIETADIYRRKAKEKGFEVLKPEHVRSGYAQEVGEGEIRVLQSLSLNVKNMIIFSVFNPDPQQNPKFIEKLDPETRAKYDVARAVINGHDYGSFGANFFHYSEKVQEIFPEIKSAKGMFDGQFRNLLKLARFGRKKAKSSGLEKNVKILAFGHENYMVHALQEYFGEHDIKNCETIDVNVDDADAILTRRGVSKKIKSEMR